jgi:hypothetical protein
MAIIDHIDPENRKIYLSSDTVNTSINPIDIYKEMRTLRRENENLRPYDVFIKAYGHIPKGNNKYTERYIVLQKGTLIVPYDTSHILTITGTILTDDGHEGVDCFDRIDLSSDTVVDINYVPPQVEIIAVNTGAGGNCNLDSLSNKVDSIQNNLNSEIKPKLNSIENNNDSLSNKVDNIQNNLNDEIKPKLDKIQENIDLLVTIEAGNWEIKNNQMLFKDENDNVILTFNLYDKAKKPAERNVYKREIVK